MENVVKDLHPQMPQTQPVLSLSSFQGYHIIYSPNWDTVESERQCY